MSNSLAAIAQGDDYQAMVFWKYANNMLRSDSDIESIGYEKIQLVTISRPSAYGEYEPYRFVSTEEEFEKLVVKM